MKKESKNWLETEEAKNWDPTPIPDEDYKDE